MNFDKLKEACSKAGITEVEVYNVKETGSSVSTFNKAVDANEAFATDVCNVRGVYNGKIATVYVENQDEENIPSIVNEIIKNAAIIESDEPYFIYPGDKEYPTVDESKHDFDSYSQEDKLALCQKIEDKIREAGHYTEVVEVGIDVVETETSIQNTSGLHVTRKGTGARLICAAVAHKGNEHKQAYAFYNLDNFKDIDYDDIIKNSIVKAESMFGAAPVESKAYPVLLDKKISQMLLAVFSGMFSAENVLKNMSQLKDKIGTKVFGENINIIDDSLHKDAINKYTFDDEGVACKRKTVVEAGVLKTYLHNLKTAAMMHISSTANGFKQGVAGNVDVKPAGLYIEPGKRSFDEVIGSMKEGLYITEMQGAHAGVNQVAGSFNLQSSGYYVKDGKIVSPVTLIIVSGNIFDLLNNVEEIASDLEFSARSGCGAPSILVKSLAVSGK